MRWDPETRRIALASSEGKVWLRNGAAQVALTGGTVIATSDPRFKVTFTVLQDSTVLSGKDEEKALDWELRVTTVDPRSVRLEWKVWNVSGQAMKLERLTVLSGQLEGAVEPESNRVLVSGHNSWSDGKVVRLVPEKKVTSHYTLALQSPAFAAGFLSGRHNLDTFDVIRNTTGLEVTAAGACDQCVLPAGAARSADPLFLSYGGHPLRQMEVFADLAARENGVQLWPENFATWCSWYAGWMRQESLYEFKDGLEKGVEENIPRVSALLGTRGTPSMRVVDDSNEMPYGDWDNATLAVGGGFQRQATLLKEAGILAGIWYPPYWVSTKSRLFQEHPELLCQDEEGQVSVGKKPMYGNHLAFLDTSNPAAEAVMERTARAWRDRGFRYVMTDFMNWGAWKKKRFDPTLTSVESYCRGLEAMRRGYGKDTYWLHCGALLGPAMGLCDGMRISGDSHGGEMFSYESAGARWFYNWRVWINDPDAIVCRRYGETKGLEWNRCWMSWMALAGNVLTYGDTFDDLPAEFVELYRKVLPPLPVAGRPLDILENEPYLLWGMDPGAADGDSTLFGVFEFHGKRAGQKIRLNLDEVAARSRSWEQKPAEAPATWLLWDFWGQKLTRIKGATLSVAIPSQSCKVYSLRPDLGRPQLLGTSGHFSQGTLETQAITWKQKPGALSGRVRGNGGEPTTLFFHVPEGMACKAATLGFTRAEPKVIEPGVLALEVPAVKGEPIFFELLFTGTPQEPARRFFVAGPVGEVK
jgi:alpha-galactosidase